MLRSLLELYDGRSRRLMLYHGRDVICRVTLLLWLVCIRDRQRPGLMPWLRLMTTCVKSPQGSQATNTCCLAAVFLDALHRPTVLRDAWVSFV